MLLHVNAITDYAMLYTTKWNSLLFVQPLVTVTVSKDLTNQIFDTPLTRAPTKGKDLAKWGIPLHRDGQECNGCHNLHVIHDKVESPDFFFLMSTP